MITVDEALQEFLGVGVGGGRKGEGGERVGDGRLPSRLASPCHTALPVSGLNWVANPHDRAVLSLEASGPRPFPPFPFFCPAGAGLRDSIPATDRQ